MSRYLVPGNYTTATIFAPVTYLPAPVLIYARNPTSNTEGVSTTECNTVSVNANNDCNAYKQSDLVLIATGVLDAVDPDRIILKKVRFYYF